MNDLVQLTPVSSPVLLERLLLPLVDAGERPCRGEHVPGSWPLCLVSLPFFSASLPMPIDLGRSPTALNRTNAPSPSIVSFASPVFEALAARGPPFPRPPHRRPAGHRFRLADVQETAAAGSRECLSFTGASPTTRPGSSGRTTSRLESSRPSSCSLTPPLCT